MRLAATHVCPEFRNLATRQLATAVSTSASSNTTNGALPPSSRLSRFSVAAERSKSIFPTAVEPVKLTLRMRASSRKTFPRAPASSRLPVSTLNAPAGTPASSAIAASAMAESGVASAGFRTSGHPTAIAGPSLRVIIAAGKFHGVMAAPTPTGCRSTTTRVWSHGEGIVSP